MDIAKNFLKRGKVVECLRKALEIAVPILCVYDLHRIALMDYFVCRVHSTTREF